MTSSEKTVPPEYAALFNQLILSAREQLNKGGHLVSTFYLGTSQSGHLQPVSANVSSPAEKEEVANAARRLAKMLSADFVVFVSEAWALPPEKAAQCDAIYAKYGSIANYPGRMDIAWFSLETRKGYFTAMAPIQKDPPSKMRRKLGPVTWQEGGHVTGRLAGILS